MSDYLSDYVYYSSGTECPEEYLWWGGMSILGHVLGHKAWIEYGDYFRFSPNLAICLVGEAGSGKNTALGVNFNIMLKHFPDLLLSSSIQSREDIAYQMSSDLCIRTWKDEQKEYGAVMRVNYAAGDSTIHDYRPFYILNNELASFLSVDKLKMVEFLTEAFDGQHFSTGFKKDRKDDPTRKQYFANPHLSLLAGAVPSWFMSNLKMDLFTGGLGRRLIIVHANAEKVNPYPRKPPGADVAMSRVIEHLKQADRFYGAFRPTDKAIAWFTQWYNKHRRLKPEDPILYQFYQTRHVLLLKVATCLAAAETGINRAVTDDHHQFALDLLTKLERPIIRLTSGIGRNELAGYAAELLEKLELKDGFIVEKEARMIFFRHLRAQEWEEVKNTLVAGDKIRIFAYPFTVEGKTVEKTIIALTREYDKLIRRARQTSSGPPPGDVPAP